MGDWKRGAAGGLTVLLTAVACSGCGASGEGPTTGAQSQSSSQPPADADANSSGATWAEVEAALVDRISARVELTPGEQIEGVTYQEAFKRAGLESPPEETPVFTAIVTVPEIGKDRATTTTESDVAPQFDHERIWLLRMPTYQTSTGGQMGMASPSSAPVGYDAHTIMMIDPDGDWYAVEVPE